MGTRCREQGSCGHGALSDVIWHHCLSSLQQASGGLWVWFSDSGTKEPSNCSSKTLFNVSLIDFWMRDNKITSRPELGMKPIIKSAFSENLLPIQSSELADLGGAFPSAVTSLRFATFQLQDKKKFCNDPIKRCFPPQNHFSVLASAVCTAPKCDKDRIMPYLHLQQKPLPMVQCFRCQCWCLCFSQPWAGNAMGTPNANSSFSPYN